MRLPPLARAAACLLTLLVLAGCGGGTAGVVHTYPRGQACLAELQRRGYVFDLLPEEAAGGCTIDTPILLRRTSIDLNQPVKLSCSLALAWSAFEQDVLLPAATQTFGQPVTRIDHFGAYSCRPIAGSNRLSEHGRGLAIDVAGFHLADGSVISVERDWNTGGRAERFLHRIGDEACRIFNVILGPDHNSDHHNHLHFDIGRSGFCHP